MTDDVPLPGSRPPHLLSAYARPPGGFDEALDAGGHPRAHWQRLLAWMEQVGPDELQRQERLALDRISEDGVAYHEQDDPVRAARPWPLDIVPLILAPDEWAVLDRGMTQRAQLLEELLVDLHGPQRSIREGVIPADLVHGVPHFLRACHEPRSARRSMLHLYACDMIRSAQGEWMVLADRTQAPAGLGFALENRVVSSRLLAEPFVEDRVNRLAVFFRAVRESLAALDPRSQENPRVVLLTPGPGNETYFENAYLAHYLGYTLVEAEDLTVREEGVYLKMLGGLKRVDVILRRIDDAYCDPVELRADSLVGVPGLVRAVRNRQVAIANALGAGLLATPALLPFLPAACRFFRGEELRLPSLPGHWCGQPDRLREVLDTLDDQAVYDVAGAQPNQPLLPARMSAHERAELVGRLHSRPQRFVTQSMPKLATLPQLEDRRIQPCHAILRTFLVNRGDGFQSMPGGLARVVGGDFWNDMPVYRGRASKDTWVMSHAPVEKFSLLMPASAPIALSRGGGDIPSRAADHLFWLGRYLERLESSVRILRVVFLRLLEQGRAAQSQGTGLLQRLVQVHPLEGLAGQPPDTWAAGALDPGRSGSLAWLLEQIQRNSGRVRDRFSGDTWRILNRLFVEIPETAGAEWSLLQRMVDWFNVTIIRLSAFGGLTMESMTRGPGWRFLDMGRRLERAQHMVGLVRHAFVEVTELSFEASACEDVLSIADNLITYRRRYLTQLQLAPLLDLLLADDSNPRALAFQLDRLREHAQALGGSTAREGDDEAPLLAALRAEIGQADLLRLAALMADNRRVALEALLDRVSLVLPALSNAWTTRYFSHSELPRQLAALASLEAP